jgi:aryl-alcohol dehydrogenase-like predicted oxidoreductase
MWEDPNHELSHAGQNRTESVRNWIWPLGIGKSLWIGASDDESLCALNRSIDLGVNFIDTALVYGDGHSEKLVGQLIRERTETIHVATKVPPKN